MIGKNPEHGVLSLLAIFLFKYYFKTCTFEMYLNKIFEFGKFSSIVLLALSNSRLACWYTFACFCAWVILQFPKYSGQTKLIRVEDETELKSYFDVDKAEKF